MEACKPDGSKKLLAVSNLQIHLSHLSTALGLCSEQQGDTGWRDHLLLYTEHLLARICCGSSLRFVARPDWNPRRNCHKRGNRHRGPQATSITGAYHLDRTLH